MARKGSGPWQVWSRAMKRAAVQPTFFAARQLRAAVLVVAGRRLWARSSMRLGFDDPAWADALKAALTTTRSLAARFPRSRKLAALQLTYGHGAVDHLVVVSNHVDELPALVGADGLLGNEDRLPRVPNRQSNADEEAGRQHPRLGGAGLGVIDRGSTRKVPVLGSTLFSLKLMTPLWEERRAVRGPSHPRGPASIGIWPSSATAFGLPG